MMKTVINVLGVDNWFHTLLLAVCAVLWAVGWLNVLTVCFASVVAAFISLIIAMKQQGRL